MKCFWQGSLWVKGGSVVEMWSLLCITFLVKLNFAEIFKNVQISSFAWNNHVKEAKIGETNIECASQCIDSVNVSLIRELYNWVQKIQNKAICFNATFVWWSTSPLYLDVVLRYGIHLKANWISKLSSSYRKNESYNWKIRQTYGSFQYFLDPTACIGK